MRALLMQDQYELVINLKTAKALGPDVARDTARPCRRGHRIGMFFVAVHMSAAGSSRT
jgi:hypothetical protein